MLLSSVQQTAQNAVNIVNASGHKKSNSKSEARQSLSKKESSMKNVGQQAVAYTQQNTMKGDKKDLSKKDSSFSLFKRQNTSVNNKQDGKQQRTS